MDASFSALCRLGRFAVTLMVAGGVLAVVASVAPLPPAVPLALIVAGAAVTVLAPLVADYVGAKVSAKSATAASADPTVHVASSSQKALRRTAQ